MDEKDIKKVAWLKNGHMANVALEYFGDEVKKELSRVMGELRVKYKDGNTDGIIYISKMGEYFALENLLNRLDRAVKTGRTIEKEIVK